MRLIHCTRMDLLMILAIFTLPNFIGAKIWDQNQLISTVSQKMFSNKLSNSVLCWKTERMRQLALTMSSMGTYFHSSKVWTESEPDATWIDFQCENRLKPEHLKRFKTIMILNVNACENLSGPFLREEFPSTKLYIVIEDPINNNGSIIMCLQRHQQNQWKSVLVASWNASKFYLKNIKHQGSLTAVNSIKVAYVASPQTQKTIKDFRRNLMTEVSARFNYQVINEVFTFLNLTSSEVFTELTHPFPMSIDLIAQPIKVSEDSFDAYDFLTTRTPNRQAFILRAPSLSSVSNVFTLPLELMVWYASYIILAITVVAIFIIVKIQWSSPDTISNTNRIMYPRALDVVHMHIGAIAQQGSEAEPTNGGGRIATFFVFLFFLFLYTAYSANIVALLGSTTTKLDGVTALIEFSIGLGVDKNDFSKDMFRNESSTEHQELFSAKLARDDCYISLDEGIERMRGEFFAFHANNDKIYKRIDKEYMDNEKCGFVEISYLSESSLLMPIRKNSIYKEFIKIGLSILLERGIHERTKYIMFSKQPKCYSGGTNFVNVALKDCYFAFVIYSGGTGMSLLIFLLEIMVSRISKHRASLMNKFQE